jgi:hypothetical protein
MNETATHFCFTDLFFATGSLILFENIPPIVRGDFDFCLPQSGMALASLAFLLFLIGAFAIVPLVVLVNPRIVSCTLH